MVVLSCLGKHQHHLLCPYKPRQHKFYLFFTYRIVFWSFSPSGVLVLHSQLRLPNMKAHAHHHSQAERWKRRQQERRDHLVSPALLHWAWQKRE